MAKQKMIIGAICLLLAPLVARATTVRRMDTAHLTRVSNLIVEGTVVDHKVVYDDGPNGPMNVRTITMVQVSRTLKHPGSALFWHRWGGVATVVLSLVALGVGRRNERLRLALLLAIAVLVSVTAHLGGTLAYGANWLKWPG